MKAKIVHFRHSVLVPYDFACGLKMYQHRNALWTRDPADVLCNACARTAIFKAALAKAVAAG